MYKGLLAVIDYDRTYIFPQLNNSLEEVLTLDQSYNHYQISGQTLIAVDKNEVYAMNITNCTPPIPTQIPSVSLAPTPCYWVEFIGYSSSTGHELWEATIQKIGTNLVVVETWLQVY